MQLGSALSQCALGDRSARRDLRKRILNLWVILPLTTCRSWWCCATDTTPKEAVKLRGLPGRRPTVKPPFSLTSGKEARSARRCARLSLQVAMSEGSVRIQRQLRRRQAACLICLCIPSPCRGSGNTSGIGSAESISVHPYAEEASFPTRRAFNDA